MVQYFCYVLNDITIYCLNVVSSQMSIIHNLKHNLTSCYDKKAAILLPMSI